MKKLKEIIQETVYEDTRYLRLKLNSIMENSIIKTYISGKLLSHCWNDIYSAGDINIKDAVWSTARDIEKKTNK